MRRFLVAFSHKFLTIRNPLRRLRRGFLVGLVVSVALGYALHANWFRDMRYRFTDSLYLPAPTSDTVVIIAIDDKSLAALGRSPATWDRTHHADLVTLLAEADARVVAFDILFDLPTSQDAAFADAMRNARRQATAVILPVVGHLPIDSPDDGAVNFTLFFEPTEALRTAATDLGHVNVFPDSDGVIRRIPLITQAEDNPYYTFGLTAYLAFQGLFTDFVRYDDQTLSFPVDPIRDFAPSWVLATDPDSRMMVYYFGEPSHVDRQNTTFLTYSYVDVLEGRVPAAAFAGKIVLVGVLDAVAQPDLFTVPITRNVPMFGVEIHANLIETIHQRNLQPNARIVRPQLAEATTTENILALVILAFAMSLVLPLLRWYVAALATLVVMLGYVVGVFVRLELTGNMMEVLYPLLTCVSAFVGTLIVNYTFEERRRTEISDLFSRYVSPEIARKVMENFDAGTLSLGGEEREITVLFADVRGFTSLAEGLTPHEVITRLNYFLEQMNTVVLKYNGTIYKYIGDNLMAFWNAPYHQADHAWLATQAATELLEVIEQINAEQQFKTPILFGIGVNTGTVIVGNIGSTERLEYTPIGDAVNVASRLSGVADGGACLLGENTYTAVKSRLNKPLPHQDIVLKGRMMSIQVYELKPPL